MSEAARRLRAARRWLGGTSNRVLIVFPAVLWLSEAALQQQVPALDPRAVPLLVAGYLQYKLTGRYRLARGGGGPGLSTPPERLVISGPYRYTRNPMYLGHLIFLGGLAWLLRSWIGLALLVFHLFWFQRRVQGDEARLHERFGAAYDAYRARVRRWVPLLF